MIEFFFELLFQLVLEIASSILFEVLTSLGWESLKDSVRTERPSTPVLAGFGHLLMGLLAGVVSLLVFGTRLVPRPVIPGLSLVLSPIATGIAMHTIGEWWRERGRDRPALFSFWPGAIFAFGMALVRFLYLEIGWRPF
jgi:hypothetical protein